MVIERIIMFPRNFIILENTVIEILVIHQNIYKFNDKYMQNKHILDIMIQNNIGDKNMNGNIKAYAPRGCDVKIVVFSEILNLQ